VAPNTAWHYNAAAAQFVCTARADLAPGDECTGSYGRKSNAQLLLSYGFCIPPNDRCEGSGSDDDDDDSDDSDSDDDSDDSDSDDSDDSDDGGARRVVRLKLRRVGGPCAYLHQVGVRLPAAPKKDADAAIAERRAALLGAIAAEACTEHPGMLVLSLDGSREAAWKWLLASARVRHATDAQVLALLPSLPSASLAGGSVSALVRQSAARALEPVAPRNEALAVRCVAGALKTRLEAYAGDADAVPGSTAWIVVTGEQQVLHALRQLALGAAAALADPLRPLGPVLLAWHKHCAWAAAYLRSVGQLGRRAQRQLRSPSKPPAPCGHPRSPRKIRWGRENVEEQ